MKKLDQRARQAVMIGYAEQSKAYKLWDPKLKKVIVSRDVTFEESKQPELEPEKSQIKAVEFVDKSEEVVSLGYPDDTEADVVHL